MTGLCAQGIETRQMGICGIAIAGGRPVQAYELEAMRLRMGGGGKCGAPLCWLPDAGFVSTAAKSWCGEDLIVVCDTDLYERHHDYHTAQWIATQYRKHGASFLGNLRGAFSLAIWDQGARLLLLAVDRFGIKSLCYAENDSEVIFATHSSGVLASGRVPRKVSFPAIMDYLVYNVVPAPRTAFTDITRLPPGQYLAWTGKGPQRKCYWDIRYPEDARQAPQVLAQDLFLHMKQALKRASADLDSAKVGCFLSGGTDSSAIVGLLTEISQSPVTAFSIGFSETRFNELEYARLAAKHFRARHVEGVLTADDAHKVIPLIVDAYDSPFANSSAIPTYWCAKLAREHGMEMLLAGDGGDELFGGNERYRTEQIFEAYHKIPGPIRRWVIEPPVLGSSSRLSAMEKLRKYIQLANMSTPDRYSRWRLLQMFSPELVLGNAMSVGNGHSDLLATLRGHYQSASGYSKLNRLLYIDVKMTLGDDDLPKVTRTAELAGVGVRFPYLDHELAEFTGRLPANLKVRRFEKRYLFKLATRTLLPAQILNKKKHGFGLPIGLWLANDARLHAWAKEILLDPRTYQRGYFRRSFIDQLFSNMQQDTTPYFGDLLWVFLMLELWHRRHAEGSAC